MGGDGYSMFLQALNPYDFGPALDQATMDYITLNSPYTPFLDGRVSTVKKRFTPTVIASTSTVVVCKFSEFIRVVGYN